MSQRFLSSLNIKTLLSVVVPALLIASLSVYVLGFRPRAPAATHMTSPDQK